MLNGYRKFKIPIKYLNSNLVLVCSMFTILPLYISSAVLSVTFSVISQSLLAVNDALMCHSIPHQAATRVC